MSLVACHDCGKEISMKAKTCVHCGCPSEYYRKNENRNHTRSFLIKMAILAVVFLGSILLTRVGFFHWLAEYIGNIITEVMFGHLFE